MIHGTGNVEYFESCETTSKVQCSYCLSDWAKGIFSVHVEIACVIQNSRVSCIEIDSMPYQFRITWSVRDALTELDMGNLRSRQCITQPSTRGNDAERGKMPQVKITQEFWTDFWRIRSTVNHKKKHGWDEAKCEEMDKLAQEDHSYPLTRSEFLRYSSNWSTGSNKPMATRPDYHTAVALKFYLYRKPGKNQKTIAPQDQDRVRETTHSQIPTAARVDKKIGWRFWTPSSSWWKTDEWNWKED